MNYRAQKPHCVTQDSEESDDDVDYRMFNRGRIRCNLRRRMLAPGVIPDDNDLDNHDSSSGSNNRVTFNVDTNSTSTSNNQQSTSSSSESGWLQRRERN